MDSSGGAVITGTLILGALVLKGTDLIKYVKNAGSESSDTKTDALNGLYTMFWSSLLGMAVVFLMAHTQWGDEIPIGNEKLGDLNWVSLVALGVTITSFAGFLNDVKKAIDGKDTASTPAISKAAEATRQEQRAIQNAAMAAAAGG
jgi:hypothetical protein